MGSILLQTIKLTPRLLWQSYAQPSKAVDFLSQDKRNSTIFIWSGFFSGLILGSFLAIPHYILYHNLLQSILFAIAIAFAFVFSFVFGSLFGGIDAWIVASAGAVIVAGSFSVALLVAYTVTDILAGEFAFVGALAGALAGTVAYRGVFVGVGAGAFVGTDAGAAIFISLLMVGGEGISGLRSYEMIICLFAFLIGYFYNSSFGFIKQNRKFKENFKSNTIKNYDVTHQKFGKTQKASFLWGPIIAFGLCLPVYLNWKPELNEKILIAALGYFLMPLFILHVPDYLLCLPLWFYQKRKILKKNNSSKDIEDAYKKSLLFTHEMLYIELPGLHKIMVSMARHNENGIKEAVERINDLYWFTFQQRQAQQAIITLGKDKETAHQYIHFLLEEKNLPLIEALAKSNRMADLYMGLFNTISLSVDSGDFIINILHKRLISELGTFKKQQYITENSPEEIDRVCREMEKEEGYRFNSEMTITLRFFQKLLASGGLKDFYSAMVSLDNSNRFPMEINYFIAFEKMTAQLQKLKTDLLKIEVIERFETKRSFLNQQNESFEVLVRSVKDNFYEPFQTLWQKALVHCAALVEREIKLLQGSAVLSIDLTNREILVPAEERNLYFIIHNKGRELADNVVVTLQTGIPLIDFSAGSVARIDIIEADTVKEIAIPIAALTPGNITVQGTITYSDSTREDKKLDFSFPLTLVKKSAEFKEIKNPYIVGQPLTGDTPLYFGRHDAYEFIDKNITASGAHHTIVCHGLRRTGKTSLLYRIESKGFKDQRLTPIIIDVQGIEDEKDFYATVSSKIREKLSLKPNVGDATVKSFSRFKEFLNEIKPVLGERIMVLMVDEFEALDKLVEAGRISSFIFDNIRHLMQHEEKLIFLFCGTHRLEEMSADYRSIFFNTAMYLKINRLKDQDAILLIKEPVKDQLNYDDLAVEQILKMTGGQPYLTQLLCRTLVNDLNENKKRNDAVIDDVDDAVEAIIAGGTEHFSQHIWDMSNTLERLLISAAAGEMTLKQLDYIGLEALFVQVQAVTANFTRKQMLEALGKLVSREILEEKEMRYRFPVNLLRKWLAARYPLRKVREEI